MLFRERHEAGAAVAQLRVGELGGLRGGAGRDVGDAEPVAGQFLLLAWVEPARGEAGQVQRGPEPVARPREVPAGRGRVQARVNAAEEHVQGFAVGGQDVGDRAVPRGVQVQLHAIYFHRRRYLGTKLTAIASSVRVSEQRERGSQMITVDAERADLLAVLAKHRHFLRFTTRDLSDEQAGRRATVSELTLGGLIKHVTLVENNWANFIEHGPSAMGGFSARTEADHTAWTDHFRLLPDETLEGVLAAYEQVAKRTDDLVRTLPDLNADQPLPPAPWFPPGERWTARRVIMHIIAETAQHAGHADIIRESIDGAKSMG
jgi:hypothetical protein